MSTKGALGRPSHPRPCPRPHLGCEPGPQARAHWRAAGRCQVRSRARALSCPPGVLPRAGSPYQPRSRLCLECSSADHRQAGRGSRGLADPATHFWAKTRGNFSPWSMSSGARPDVPTPERGFLENRSCLPRLPGRRRGCASGAGACRPSCRCQQALLTPPPGCPQQFPCAVFKLLTFLKCQGAFLSLPTMPSGDAGLAQGGGTFCTGGHAGHLLGLRQSWSQRASVQQRRSGAGGRPEVPPRSRFAPAAQPWGGGNRSRSSPQDRPRPPTVPMCLETPICPQAPAACCW